MTAAALADAVREAEEALAIVGVCLCGCGTGECCGAPYYRALRSLLAAVKAQPPEITEAVREAAVNFVCDLLEDWRESDYSFDGESVDGWAKKHGFLVEVPPGSHAGTEWDCDACEGGQYSCWELRLPDRPTLSSSRPPDSGDARGETEKEAETEKGMP